MGDFLRLCIGEADNKRDPPDISTDVLDKVQIIFYSDPINAAFRAMGLD